MKAPLVSDSLPIVVTLREVKNQRGEYNDEEIAIFNNVNDFLDAVHSAIQFNNAEINDISIYYTVASDDIFNVEIQDFIMSRDGEKFRFSLDKALKNILALNLFKIQVHIVFKDRLIFKDIIAESGNIFADKVRAKTAVRTRLKNESKTLKKAKALKKGK